MPTNFGCSLFLISALEEFIPAHDLGILTILDLDPAWIVVGDRIAALAMFGNDALEVARTDQLEQALALSLNVVHVHQEGAAIRHDTPQQLLTLDELSLAQVLAVEMQQVESAKPRRTAAEEQLVELRVALIVQAGDLAVYNRMPGLQEQLNAGAEVLETGESVAVPRYQSHPGRIAICERAKAVVLNFEQPVRMGERLGPAG